MFRRIRKVALIGGVLAAVSFGGSALAAAGAAPVQPTHVAVTTREATDGETADGTTALVGKDGDADTADGPSFGHEEADEETSDGGSGASENGSETPGNDGPGGHADEPGNPNAQHGAGGQTEE